MKKYPRLLIIAVLFHLSAVLPAFSAEFHKGELSLIADTHHTDKGTWHHNYTEVYEYFFFPIKDNATAIFEIGVLDARGMMMFRDYFPNAFIYGIDIHDKSKYDGPRMLTGVADQANRRQLTAFLKKTPGKFDVVLDDGGHTMEQQQVSFGHLFPSVKPGALYIIEDVHTSIMSDYGANKDLSNTTLTMIDRFIRTGKIESRYLTAGEIAYLNENLDYAVMLSRNNGRSISCIFKKKG